MSQLRTKRTKRRKHSRRHLALRIIRDVRNHPANSDAPNSATLRAVAWQLRKRIGRQPLTMSAFGMDLQFPGSSGSASNLVYFGECYEWETINFIRSYLQPGDIVVDVGANVGMFTYAALQRVLPGGQVHAFEPTPWAAQTIHHNVDRNRVGHRVHVYEFAASDKVGTARFTADLDVSNHMEFGNLKSNYPKSDFIEVRIAPLDSLLPEEATLSLAKIDVEGAGTKVLTGFLRHLENANPPVILIEAHDHSLRKMGSSRDEAMALLADNGYEVLVFDVDAHRLERPPATWGADVVAVHAKYREAVERRLKPRSGLGPSNNGLSPGDRASRSPSPAPANEP